MESAQPLTSVPDLLYRILGDWIVALDLTNAPTIAIEQTDVAHYNTWAEPGAFIPFIRSVAHWEDA